MTATISEAYLSRDGSDGESYQRELIYYTFGDSDESASATVLLATAPATYDGLPQKNIRRKQVTQDVYEWTVEYRLDQNQVQPSDPATDTFNTTLTFNLIGGTKHITTAYDTTGYVGPGGTVVGVQKTIGIDLKTGQVRGVDVFAPVLDYSLTTQFANSIVTTAYIDKVFDLTGKTNDAVFKGRQIGEVLFKGARGQKRGNDRWEISFEFAYSKNETGIAVGDITGISKKGWEYLDVLYKDSPTLRIANRPVQVPAQVNVHQVYKSGSFADLKIGVA